MKTKRDQRSWRGVCSLRTHGPDPATSRSGTERPMPRASRACAVLVAMLVLAVVAVDAARAAPVTVDGTFLSFTSSIFTFRPASVNGISLTTPGTTTIIDPNTGSTQYLSDPVFFTGPTTRLDFQYDPPLSGLLNSFEWIPNTADVNFGDEFQLGTIRYTNGQWFYHVDIGFTLTTHCAAPCADPRLDGQIFSGTIRLLVNQDVTLPFDPDEEADFFFLWDPDPLSPLRLVGSCRVYDVFRQPPSNPGNVGECALLGRIGSLIPTGFVALNSAAFTHPSIEPGPLQVENHPPVCTGATAGPSTLWPPNHQMVPISITGVTDPDGDPVTITATGITQDEAVRETGIGSGNTAPDASLSPLAVRSERNGNPKTPGNGRVYHIDFTADDGKGGSCNGTVKVCVPHDQRPGATCVDGGPLFNSLAP